MGRIDIYGRCEEWFIIELSVFLTFMGTMIILMIKSRFSNIGFDNSLSFDPKYMSRMANFICQNFEWDFSNLVGPETKIEKHKEQDHVSVNGLKLLVNWEKKDYDAAKEQIFMLNYDVVKPDDATDWIKRNVVGEITKDQLDYARYKEV